MASKETEDNNTSYTDIVLGSNIGPLGGLRSNLYKTLTDQTKDDYKRFGNKIGTSGLRGGLEIYRMITEPREGLAVSSTRGGGVNIPKGSLEERKAKRLEGIEKTEKVIDRVYSALVGADNVERTARGDYTTSQIKDPVSPTLDIISDIGEIAAGIGVASKYAKGVEAVTKTQKFLKGTAVGEIGYQGVVNPYNDEKIIPAFIASMLTEDDGLQGDLKTYLEADPQTKSQLQNRVDELADGILFATIFQAGGAVLKGGYNYGKGKLDKTEFRKQFTTYLNNISSKGQEAVDTFIEKISTVGKIDKAQKRTALSHRNKNIENGKVVDMGDSQALEPGPISKWISDINLQFSENSILRGLENSRTKLFSTRGGKSRGLHEKFLRTENLKEKWSDNINNLAYNLESSIDDIVKTIGPDKEDVLAQLNKVLFWDRRSPTLVTSKGISLGTKQADEFEKALKKLPENLRQPVRDVRNLQDNLSKLMLETNYLTPTQKEIYNDGIGFYVRRSYKLFEDPNYVPTAKAFKEAENFLIQQKKLQNPNITDDELLLQVNADMNLILRNNTNSADFGANLEKFDMIRKSILNGRKDIPPVLRNLMGEIDNPVQSIIHSTTKLSKLLEDAKFYDESFDNGLGIYFREGQEGIFREEIPAGYGKLSGTYTSPDLLKYFSDYKKFSQTLLEDEKFGVGLLYRNTLLLKGLSQAAKTVWSHATHIKNIAGGVQMSLANGINVFDIGMTKRIRAVLNAKTSNDKELQAFHEELSGRGLLNKGVVARDLQGLASDVAKIKKGAVVGKIDWLLEKMPVPYYSFKNAKFQVTSPKGLAGAAQEKYIAQDDFFKINMYIREQDYLNQVNKALPEDSKFDFYRFTEETVKDEAALITRDVLPNYDLVPEMLKDLRRTPFFGRFFSFMAESVRIASNSITRGIKEVKFGNHLKNEGAEEAGKLVRDRGTLRLAAFTTVAGATAKGAEVTSSYISGLGKDDVEAYKDMSADYMQNSNVTIAVAPDGTPMIGNLSSWDAYDFPKKPIQVIINKAFSDPDADEEGLAKEILSTLTKEMVSPFLGESIVQEQISNYIGRNGRDINGRLMRNPFDKTSRFDDSGEYIENIFKKENLTIFMGNLMESITPGTITRGAKWIDTIGEEQTSFDQDIYPAESFVKFLTGYGMQPMNKEYLQNIYEYKASDLMKRKSNRRRRLFDGLGDKLNIDKFANKYLEENLLYYKDFAKFQKMTQSADKLNLNTIPLLKKAGMPRGDIINFIGTQRTYTPLGVTDTLKTELLDKTENSEDFVKVLMDIRAIDAELSNLPVIFDPENYKGQQSDIDEIKENLRKNFEEGGVVSDEFPVAFAKKDPKDRASDDLGGEPYQEQMDILGFKK